MTFYSYNFDPIVDEYKPDDTVSESVPEGA